MNDNFKQAANMAADLNSPGCINWDELYQYFEKHGKDKTRDLINREYIGANSVYCAHLSLAYTAVINS